MSSIFGWPRPQRLFAHLWLADGGRDDHLAHASNAPAEPFLVSAARQATAWQETVARVLSRRRTAVGRALQRWACALEMRLRTYQGGGAALAGVA